MKRICGQIVIDFSCKVSTFDFLEKFDVELVEKALMVLTNTDGEQIRLNVDHHETVLLFNENDEQVI